MLQERMKESVRCKQRKEAGYLRHSGDRNHVVFPQMQSLQEGDKTEREKCDLGHLSDRSKGKK